MYSLLTMFAMYSTLISPCLVPPERAVLNKERATGSYRLSAYFFGKTLAETPLELLLPIMFGSIVYWMVQSIRTNANSPAI